MSIDHVRNDEVMTMANDSDTFRDREIEKMVIRCRPNCAGSQGRCKGVSGHADILGHVSIYDMAPVKVDLLRPGQNSDEKRKGGNLGCVILKSIALLVQVDLI
jgi:hypothetical protein